MNNRGSSHNLQGKLPQSTIYVQGKLPQFGEIGIFGSDEQQGKLPQFTKIGIFGSDEQQGKLPQSRSVQGKLPQFTGEAPTLSRVTH